jgi:cobaltochelatase CobT
MSIMLRNGILKENIDGEAMLWAIQRLLAVNASQKLLFVLSDGAPVDDSTLSVSPGNFLEMHLRDVIRWAARQPNLKLKGVGIGHDLSRYFADCASVNVESLGLPVLETVTAAIKS